MCLCVRTFLAALIICMSENGIRNLARLQLAAGFYSIKILAVHEIYQWGTEFSSYFFLSNYHLRQSSNSLITRVA
jgi:hypothetical protein